MLPFDLLLQHYGAVCLTSQMESSAVADVEVIRPVISGSVYKPSIQDGGPIITFTPRQYQVRNNCRKW